MGYRYPTVGCVPCTTCRGRTSGAVGKSVLGSRRIGFMRNVRFGLAAIALGVLALCLPARANATTFTLDLDCIFAGGSGNQSFNGNCASVASQGTISYDTTTGAGSI